MKSQSNRKGLDEILSMLWAVGVSVKPIEYSIHKQAMGEAKAKLLALALSCLPEKKDEIDYSAREGVETVDLEAVGYNAAIDTIEQNIRGAFS